MRSADSESSTTRGCRRRCPPTRASLLACPQKLPLCVETDLQAPPRLPPSTSPRSTSSSSALPPPSRHTTFSPSSIGDEWKGYVLRITGGNDKQGFPMKQGVLLPHRVRLLLADGHSCYRSRRAGERKRKSVRGCIVGNDIAVLSLVIVKQGEQDIEGLTTEALPKRLGPKVRTPSASLRLRWRLPSSRERVSLTH